MKPRAWILVWLAGAACAALVSCRSAGTAGPLGDASCEDTEASVCWPRFPPAGPTRVLPRLAVFLSTGEINQNTTMARLGYPDRLLFRLHQELPRLRIVLVGSPANRYSGDRDVTRSPEGAATWKALATEPRFDWIEIGGQGFTHSPPEDTNLGHHEFATDQTGCNLDHARMGTPEYCRERLQLARHAYDALGLPRNGISLIRYPGLADSPAALSAASETGFLAVLGNHHPEETGRPHWIAHPTGEILDLENTKISDLAPAANPTADAGLDTAAAMRRIEKTIKQGGVLNLRGDLQDLFDGNGDVTPACRLLTGLLREVDDQLGPEAWYPSGRDLALWLDLRRHARVTLTRRANALELRVEPPESWSAVGHVLETAAIGVHVPEGWKRIAGVSIGGSEDRLAAMPSWGWFWAGPRRVIIPFAVRGPVRIRVTGG